MLCIESNTSYNYSWHKGYKTKSTKALLSKNEDVDIIVLSIGYYILLFDESKPLKLKTLKN